MADIKRTEIAELGEFGLIDHLTKDLKPQNASTLYGVGDDCAVLDYSGKDKEVLVTTDMLMEGVHFDLTYVPLKHLGYKSAMVNISDIYAMNGTPRQMTVSVALSKRFSVEDMEDFYAGIVLACQRHNVDLVGGVLQLADIYYAIYNTILDKYLVVLVDLDRHYVTLLDPHLLLNCIRIPLRKTTGQTRVSVH